MSQKKLEFSTVNARVFTLWLKKFESFDNSLLLEIDVNNKLFIAKSYDVDKSAVKQAIIDFDDAGLELAELNEKITSRIKVGLLNIPKLIKTFEHFNDNEFEFIINYDEIT